MRSLAAGNVIGAHERGEEPLERRDPVSGSPIWGVNIEKLNVIGANGIPNGWYGGG
jgi:hypothetical protein